MYSQDVIDALEKRIGWPELSSGLPFDLTEDNKTAESKKTFNFYHPLVLVDNVYASLPDSEISEEDFNKFLKDTRLQAVLNVLTSIFDQSSLYEPAKDYSIVIEGKYGLFDDAIGYTVAIKIIELFISTSRKNFLERNANMSYQALKIELEGAKNEKGFQVAKGLSQKLADSIKKARRIIFPVSASVNSNPIW